MGPGGGEGVGVRWVQGEKREWGGASTSHDACRESDGMEEGWGGRDIARIDVPHTLLVGAGQSFGYKEEVWRCHWCNISN